MTRITYVRHCESEANRTPERVGGRNNLTPPSARGLIQAVTLGEYLRAEELSFDAVYSSGALRADETARRALYSARIAQEFTIDERLQEVSQGQYEGMLQADVYTDDVIARYRLNEIDCSLPTTESVGQAQVRMMDFLYDIDGRHNGGNVLIFSHGLAIRSLVGKINNLTKPQILTLSTPNVSLTEIVVENGIPKVHYVGKTVIKE